MEFEEKELDYAAGYFCVISRDKFVILDNCPADIRARLEVDWERVRRETMDRHEKGIYNYARDYF